MKDTVTEHLTKPRDTLDSRMDDGQRELVNKWKNKTIQNTAQTKQWHTPQEGGPGAWGT